MQSLFLIPGFGWFCVWLPLQIKTRSYMSCIKNDCLLDNKYLCGVIIKTHENELTSVIMYLQWKAYIFCSN